MVGAPRILQVAPFYGMLSWREVKRKRFFLIKSNVQERKVTLYSLDDVAALLYQHSWIFVDDLGSSYWHLLLHPSQFEYFGCDMKDPKMGQKVHFHSWYFFLE